MTDLAFSPLATVDIESIFAANPRELIPADHIRLVTELRARRSAFASDEAAKAAAGKKGRAKAEPISAPEAAKLDKPNSQLTLDDLI